MAVNGTYILEKNENLDAFLTTLGLKEEKVQQMCAAKPTITLNMAGGKLDIQSKVGDKDVHNVLTLGECSVYTLASGFEIKVNLSISGSSGKGTLKHGDHCGDFTMDFTDTHVTEVFNIGGQSCKRVYKRT